ncbi:phosphohydrolase [Mycoplasma sp. CAG:956]|nr:phosphohydrolase [Mycoplasma sp. CAG:956]
MSKEQDVINYYVLCNKLKNVIRTGWLDWKVQKNRLESIAEHIYGVQMLAIHELGETIIGDLTQFQISKEEKEKMEHEAVHSILSSLIDGDKIEDLFLEFDSHATAEARFAYQCDKLECDIQCKLYDQEGCVDLKQQEGNATADNELVKKLLENGQSWSDMWLEFGQRKYPYDKNFRAVSEYAKNNYIEEEITKKLIKKDK